MNCLLCCREPQSDLRVYQSEACLCAACLSNVEQLIMLTNGDDRTEVTKQAAHILTQVDAKVRALKESRSSLRYAREYWGGWLVLPS